MIEELKDYFIYLAGIFGFMIPWINRFEALKAYQGGKESIYNLFATASSVVCFLFVNSNIQIMHFLPKFYFFMIAGVMSLLVIVLVSEYRGKKNRNKQSIQFFLFSVSFYSIGIGLFTLGLSIKASESYYYSISGELLQAHSISEKKYAPVADFPMLMETSLDNVSFTTKNDSSGRFVFYIDKEYIDKATRIFACKGMQPPVFRNIDIQEMKGSNDKKRELPQLIPLKISKGNPKCETM